ncbi:hypothetical protein CA54_49570 [Symmachiella macrocystis]|uniref:Uncharacterized protein n=1 Tax=Symmachiella macrocystis TaxID=2527985 RepID=A0A5C6BBU5_9PLAN|nr:hypothetical protein CA54_49570 [Symmachiella macrocystis]
MGHWHAIIEFLALDIFLSCEMGDECVIHKELTVFWRRSVRCGQKSLTGVWDNCLSMRSNPVNLARNSSQLKMTDLSIWSHVCPRVKR